MERDLRKAKKTEGGERKVKKKKNTWAKLRKRERENKPKKQKNRKQKTCPIRDTNTQTLLLCFS